eukprot:TRINITY_DN65768_c0_g1_i1.p2 TRINITY_DN65768_c0_g1~~TRINITY_DN65768_c0_g1_i1.p2  ORF type:complete len:186 (+),score=35.18 TRINITY_DN65768_c0_g1_i1:151-708(+)
MLIPMPPMPQQTGPPSSFLVSWRPWMLVLLLLQTMLCFFRIVLPRLLDIMGGFIMSIICGLGWYGWSKDMHITFICYWGMMGAINGTFDLVALIDYAVKLPPGASLFSSDMPFEYNFTAAVRVGCPISLMIGGYAAYSMYSRMDEPAARGGGEWADDRPMMPRGSTARQSTFQTFAGQGQRLGGE